MATIRYIDSFQHQVGIIAGPWYTISNGGTGPNHGGGGVTFDEAQVRTANHTCSLKIAEDGATATNAQFVALNSTPSPNLAANIIVFSFYIRVATNPGAQSEFWVGGNATDVSRLEIDTTGHVVSQVKAGTAQTSAASISDGNWHRIDIKLDYSTTTGKLDVQVDGVANTQATATVTVANITAHRIGSTVAADNLTAWYSDYCVSGTSADYPIGDHICLPVFITGDGTHSQGAGAFQKQDAGTTDYFQSVDEPWDGTTPELSQTGEDFVAQTANDGAGYVEFTIGTPAASGAGTYWNVQLRGLWASKDATTADNCAIRLRHSVTDYCVSGLIDPSISSTQYTGFQMADQGTVPSGGWDATKIGAALIRYGFSTDAAPDPLLNAVMLEYAASWTPPAPSAPAVGRLHVRAIAAGIKRGITAAAGRLHIRATAVGKKIAFGSAVGRIHVRGTAIGSEVVAIQSVAAVGRIHVRSAVTGFKIGIASASGRVHIRGVAQGVQIYSGSAVGRLHIRGTATGAPFTVPTAPAIGRIHVRGTARGFKIATGSAHGRMHVRGTGQGIKIALGSARGRIHVWGTATGQEPLFETASAIGRIHVRATAIGGETLEPPHPEMVVRRLGEFFEPFRLGPAKPWPPRRKRR